ncbi:MAG: ZPR1 zinc finger domain-containing protein [Promethearchaeota archaeon]|nr:MAG: ZPR1 zinc finger domain-containing protein [Candidatus Lokiarchaeota archaeon]
MTHNPSENDEDLMFKCPSCKKGIININTTEYDLPDGDKMLIISFKCNQCGFQKNDVIPLTTRMDPGIMTLRITEENDLKSKIYRSPMGKLIIPELELEVQPGPNADFYYTNVEGILLRFEQAVSIYRKSLPEDDPEINEIEEILKALNKATRGELEFNLKIIDMGGGSYIIPQDESKYTFEKLKDIQNNDE